MNAISDAAKASGARMSVLETQSCNENAIAFYRKNGFEIIGFDLYSCSNTDPELYNLSAKTSAYSNNLFNGFEPCFSV